MPNLSSPAALPQYIEQLLKDRKQHVDAVTHIDGLLSRVTSALGVSGTTMPSVPVARTGRRGRPPGSSNKASAPTGRRGRPRTGMTANEFVLAFIQEKKDPTTQQINEHWKAANRSGVADNALSILTRAKKIKRIPLGEGQRGSRYTIA